jgi:hypothetical protein
MARGFSRWTNYLKSARGGSVFVVVAVIGFGAIVFLLFRSHGAGLQEAVAGDTTPITTVADNTTPASPVTTAGLLSGGIAVAGEAPTAPAGTALTPTEMVRPQPPEIEAGITEALSLVRSQPGAVIQARDKLNKLLQGQPSPEQRQTIKDQMARLSQDWLFGPAAYPGDLLCDSYAVKSGDVLDVLGRRMKVPYEVLMQINGIQQARSLQKGRTIKMIHGPFHVKVYRSTFTMDLYLQDMYVRSFKVGLGAPGSETPTGLWRVKDGGKLIQPPWYDKRTNRTYRPTDPDYPLGTRWIALDGLEGNAKGRTGFAIHGTKDPDQIGTAASQGCIRMYNGEAELMYNLLVPIYSQVEVVD